jgi:hypothetical protein
MRIGRERPRPRDRETEREREREREREKREERREKGKEGRWREKEEKNHRVLFLTRYFFSLFSFMALPAVERQFSRTPSQTNSVSPF